MNWQSLPSFSQLTISESMDILKPCFSYEDYLALKLIESQNYNGIYSKIINNNHSGTQHNCVKLIELSFNEFQKIDGNKAISRDCNSDIDEQNNFIEDKRNSLSSNFTTLSNNSTNSSKSLNYQCAKKKSGSISSKSMSEHYETPLQKNIKMKKQLHLKMKNIKEKIANRQQKINALEDGFLLDLITIEQRKQKLFESINREIQSTTDQIYQINHEKEELIKAIHHLEYQIEEMQEMTKLKEVKKRDSYFQLHQKGRQAFEFTRKSEITHNFSSTYSVNALEEVIDETKTQLKSKVDQKYINTYEKYKDQTKEFTQRVIKFRNARNCFYFFVTSKTKSEKKTYVQTLLDILGFDDDTKNTLLSKNFP